MKVTGQLEVDHQGVLAMLGSFETILDRMVGGGAPDRAELASILNFLRVFADKCPMERTRNFFSMFWLGRVSVTKAGLWA